MNFFDVFLGLAERIFWSMWISIGFALLFNTPRRALWITGLLGGVGWGIKFMLLGTVMPEQIVITSFLGACAVGLLAVYFAHRVHTPPIVFTIPAVINMIPGKFGYEFMMNIIKIVTVQTPEDETLDLLFKTFKLGLQTGFITMCLAFGVIAPMLLFNTYSVKDKDLNDIIKRRLLRKKAEGKIPQKEVENEPV
ncbi:threonine/serine exporter family protein [Capnocytophaga ochracea]|uniref:threonine/serine exporter family protein n=1 Tax=Capnocytophaga ochracea TaxID=1018 RepID=UPI0022302FF7|nr:threonine/serine exporter family protein [Capnocytophaga ochracea]UZD38946.1 threonine/serine exporter family protein [Capnocytophaga ochracea]